MKLYSYLLSIIIIFINHYFQIVPIGFRKVLNWIKNNYNNPNILICESGFSDDGRIEDDERIKNTRVSINNHCFETVMVFYLIKPNSPGYRNEIISVTFFSSSNR